MILSTIFHDRFHEIRKQSWNAMALLRKWATAKFYILNSPSVKASERKDCLKLYNEETVYFLALLKLIIQRPKFDDAVRSLISLSPT